MEKMDNTPVEERKYQIVHPIKFSETFEDGILPFKDIIPAKKELSVEVLKKMKEIEYSEANAIKTFLTVSSKVFNKGNLVYSPKDHKFYKVVDFKTDDAFNPISASLVVKDGDDKIEISDKSDFDNFRNNLKLNLVISSSKSDNMLLAIEQKIYDKFEDTLNSVFSGIGLQLMSFKLFFNSRELDKSLSIAQMKEIKDGDYIYAAEGLGKPSKFYRFKSVYTAYGWSNSGNYPDGIAFIPNQNIKVWGFSWFAARSKDSYQMRYRVRINGADVEDETIDATGWEDEHFFRRRLNGVYDAPAGAKIEFTAWIAENLTSHSYVETYYGEGGYDYEQFENEHMGLFKIESGGESSNGTSVYSGHFGEIFYYLC